MGALRRLRRWFLGPVPATAVAALRIVCVARCMIQLPRMDLWMRVASELPPVFRPQSDLLPVAWPPPAGTHTAVVAAAWALGAAALLGIGTRAALAAFAAVFGYLSIGAESLGRVDHSILLPMLVLPALVVCPGSTAVSIDGWIRRRRTGSAGPALVPRWGVATVLLLVACVYATSGVSKLRWSDGRWGDGSTLQRYFSGASADPREQLFAAVDDPSPDRLWKDGVALEHHLYRCRSSPAARALARSDAVMRVLSVAGIALELLVPLLLVSRRWRNRGIAAAIAFHASNGAFMGLAFLNYQWVLLALVDVRALGRRLSGRPGSARAVVLFDGTCGLCDRTVDALLRRDPGARFRYAALQSAAGGRILGMHGLPPTWTTSIVVIADGRALVRSDAAIALAARLDGAWRLAGALRLLPRPLRDAVYDGVAAVRYRVFGRRAACRVPTPAERSRFLVDAADVDGADVGRVGEARPPRG